jgi:nicotine blue oxidoreductase
MSTAALVLAAGGSRRLGRPKQLVDWGGRPLLEVVVGAVSTWPVEGIVVVLGAVADEILERVDLGDALVVVNPEWEEGISSSIRAGLDVLTRDARYERTFVVLGDQPRIPAEVPAMLAAAMDETRRPAAVPRYRYQRGNPVLIERSLWSRFMSLSGDAGGAGLLRAHPQWVTEVRVDDLPPDDVDVPDDVPEPPRGD